MLVANSEWSNNPYIQSVGGFRISIIGSFKHCFLQICREITAFLLAEQIFLHCIKKTTFDLRMPLWKNV